MFLEFVVSKPLAMVYMDQSTAREGKAGQAG